MLRELRREGLPMKANDRIVRNAAAAALRVARKDIAAAAPRGTRQVKNSNMKFGPLHKNIKVRKMKKARGVASAKVTTGKAFWGFILEKGRRDMPARPWFDPAFNRSKPAVLARFREAVSEGIEREWRKLK